MKKSESQKTEAKKDSVFLTDKKDNFLIVGIGASAGGVQALKTFFENVPADSGAAYIVILHLSPDHDSQLAAILQTVARIPVTQVQEKTKIEPNKIYVVPPNESLSTDGDYIIVTPVQTVEERRAPVDIFFRTLAESHYERAIAVILSGTGANGSMGIKRIKENGGAAFVQNPREAEFSDMPRNSIATELIDEVLNVAEIPAKIIAYKENLGKVVIPTEPEDREEEQQKALREIFTLLCVRTGHDFANYKRPTILRRIERRVNVRRFQSLSEYVIYLKENADETQALLKDLLISVTNFFRDHTAFSYLENEVLPKIFEGKKAKNQIRVWVAGCATGEEAYSLAMLLTEKIGNSHDAPGIQIFATDIDENAIAAARNGFYTLNDAADVSPERLNRFFIHERNGFRIRRELREMILFANHNLLKDPPFSHLDLVTCRNLLIYFNRTAQERVMETFHFALNPNGYLFLGSSESIDGAGDLFDTTNREERVFKSRQVVPRVSYPLPDLSPSFRFSEPPRSITQITEDRPMKEPISYGDLHHQLLEQYAPPSIIVNEKFDVVHVSESAGRYLQIAGEVSNNIFKLLHPELRLNVSSAVYQAVDRQTNIKIENLRVPFGEQIEIITVNVRPVLRRQEETVRGYILIIFEQTAESFDLSEEVFNSSEPLTRGLEDALVRAQMQFRYSVEQSEYQAEELKASNEELQAINEELRSALEELETGKEELQSVNEELVTVNQELKIKIEELSQSNNDFLNLINSTNIGTIFLDRNMRVKLFTPAINDIFNLIPADNGRLISDITNKLEYQGLIADVETVLSKLQTVEREVSTTNGTFYLMQITPYRTAEDRISGTIIAFVNITERKRHEDESREFARRIEQQANIFNTTLSSIIDFAYIFDKDGRFIYSNQPLLDLLGITLEEIVGKNFYDLNYPKDLAERLQSQIHKAFDKKTTVRDETPFTSRSGANGYYEYIFNPVIGADGTVELVAGSTRDITERKRREAHPAFLAEISRDLSALNGIDEIMQTVGAKIGAYLNLSVCAFVEVNETKNEAVINHAWHRKDVPDVKGAYHLSEYVSDDFLTVGRAGENFIVSDTQTDARTDADAYAALKIGAFLSVPLVEDNELQFLIVVYDSAPHVWQADEIEVINDLTTRVWRRLERERADNALRESQERLQLAAAVSGFGIHDYNPVKDHLYWSPELKAMHGLPADANVTFECFDNCIHPDDRARINHAVEAALDPHGNGEFEQEFRIIRADNGETRWLYNKSRTHFEVTGKKRRPIRNTGIVVDVHSLKYLEEAVRESESRLQLIMRSVEDYAIVTVDTNGIINGWNRGAEVTFGYTQDEILGCDTAILFTPEDRRKNIPAKERQAALKNGSSEDERWHLRKDGSRFYVSGVMQPLKDGRIDGFVKIARDMTEKIKAEQIKRDKEILQKLVGAQENERRRIARDLHDELGQLLTGLRLKLESVRKLCDDNELCGKIDDTQLIAKRLDEGIDFLAWELRPAALDDLGLRAALVKYVKEWSHFAGVTAELLDSGIKRSRLTPEAETNLYRIAQEALNNVHKHAKAKRVEVSLEKRGSDLIILIISDDGKGFNVKNKMNRGKGIGLIGMQERATLLGGTFEIESSPGNGTTVFVRVPTKFIKRETLNE